MSLPGLTRTNATIPLFGNTPTANLPRAAPATSLFNATPRSNPAPASSLFATPRSSTGTGGTATKPSSRLFGAPAGGTINLPRGDILFSGGAANPAPAASVGLFKAPAAGAGGAPSLFGAGIGLLRGTSKPVSSGLFGGIANPAPAAGANCGLLSRRGAANSVPAESCGLIGGGGTITSPQAIGGLSGNPGGVPLP